ncbi:hypothetical protein AQUSIP_08110 [Aquicella siphonis]|uniref:Uncharacterized protein n=1 Tax=Aquicella siphonis TaxID=254247 RepID=A0A5E4PGS8_9COXI|nr:hypothetical protein [Aquicella siphonis]VVC75521.1 hypothetical protein AQUSIP_08110 [Aquicella siphonis]
MSRSRFDNIIYINLTQDQVLSQASALVIHKKPVELIKIPEGADIGKTSDPKLLPRRVSNTSKVYFSAHGSEEIDWCVTDRRTGDAKIYDVKDVAAYLAKILIDAKFKDPHLSPRLTLVMSVCEGVGFAKKLQKRLFSKYHIFIDVIANKFVVHEQYEHNTKDHSVNITHRITSVKDSGNRQHQRPHSKVLLVIDEQGKQTEIDAYELKWIHAVTNTLNKKLNGFLRWADFDKRENIDTANGIKILCHDIAVIIRENINVSINKTANLLLALLMSSQKTSADPAYKNAMKYLLLNTSIQNLINQGEKHIAMNSELLEYHKKLDAIEQKKAALSDLELAGNVIKAAKHKYSLLLAEAAEQHRQDLLPDIEEARKEISQLNDRKNKT